MFSIYTSCDRVIVCDYRWTNIYEQDMIVLCLCAPVGVKNPKKAFMLYMIGDQIIAHSAH